MKTPEGFTYVNDGVLSAVAQLLEPGAQLGTACSRVLDQAYGHAAFGSGDETRDLREKEGPDAVRPFCPHPRRG